MHFWLLRILSCTDRSRADPASRSGSPGLDTMKNFHSCPHSRFRKEHGGKRLRSFEPSFLDLVKSAIRVIAQRGADEVYKGRERLSKAEYSSTLAFVLCVGHLRSGHRTRRPRFVKGTVYTCLLHSGTMAYFHVTFQRGLRFRMLSPAAAIFAELAEDPCSLKWWFQLVGFAVRISDLPLLPQNVLHREEGRKESLQHPWQPTRLNGWNSVCLSSA